MTTRGDLVSEIEGMTEVASDGRTVWVNNNFMCIARFCPVSHEYMPSLTEIEARKHAPEGPSIDDWYSFVHGVQHRFNIIVTDRHMPKGLRS